ncbi:MULTISPECIES: hypothetical protein [Rhodococcus]|uniref:Uncharacterized protein n=1 Tax=Rhodococcus qingshengii JCM 15477 TaxID=1303681 RepID=A0AB38RQM1_RHOSG|nr:MULTISPECIES: hypothetical protein [Rhodococcus]MCC4306069.1 hypothetical protein [Rhodococcus sp. 3-2]UPU47005.1 hypothetical protein M0639_34865 [Rhodococcus qingshengii JCM 15477]
MSARKVARESLEDAFSAPSGPGRRGAGLARMLPPTRAPRPPVPVDPVDTAEQTSPAVDSTAPDMPMPEEPERSETPPDPKVSSNTQAPSSSDSASQTHPVEALQPAKSPMSSLAAPSADPEGAGDVKPAEQAASSTPVTNVDDAPDDVDAVENMPIYIDSATLTALKAEKGRIGGTYAEVAEVALDEQIGEVGEILRQRSAKSQQAGAFSSLPKRRKSPQIRGGIQVQLRFTKAQRDWLDEKVAEFGAPSRSVVVAVALQIHLGTRPK